MRRKLLVGAAIVPALIGLTAFDRRSAGHRPGAGSDRPRHPDQPALGRHRRRARHLHAGRLRAGRDRLLPGQARRPRGVDELRHLRPRASSASSSSATPLMFGGFYACRSSASTRRRAGTCIGSGDWVFLWQGRLGRSAATSFYTAGAMGIFLYMVAFMDTVATIPTGAMAERWKWKAFVGWGLFCGAIYYPLFGAWTWGGGWLAKLGNSMRPRLRLRRLRRLRRRARRRWCRRPGRCHRARAPHRQVQQGRLAQHAARPPHPDGHARHVHPAVRLVRLQRRLDLRGHRHPVRRGRHRTPRSPRAFGAVDGDVLHDDAGPASPTPG